MKSKEMVDNILIIRKIILEDLDFIQANFSGRQGSQTLRWERLIIRPVLIKHRRHLQFSYFDKTKNITKNYAEGQAVAKVDQVLAMPFRNYHVNTLKENFQLNLTKKGKVIFSRTKTSVTKEINLAHDQRKNTLLGEGQNVPFLHKIGVMKQDGKIKAAQRNKFQQINAFIQILSEINEIRYLPDPIHMIDFGCGSAYLTFSSYYYLHNFLEKDVHVLGVDKNQELVQKNKDIAKQLGWENLRFEHSCIADYKSNNPPNIVTALHACDTASDDAIAQGILWKSEVIIVSPCCHHDLQVQLKERVSPSAFVPVMHHGLFYERQADIITDTFRSLILQIMGYRVGVLQFVSPDHTPKNLLIRAVRTGKIGHQKSIEEYLNLKEFWQVTPHLHHLLEPELEALIQVTTEGT